MLPQAGVEPNRRNDQEIDECSPSPSEAKGPHLVRAPVRPALSSPSNPKFPVTLSFQKPRILRRNASELFQFAIIEIVENSEGPPCFTQVRPFSIAIFFLPEPQNASTQFPTRTRPPRLGAICNQHHINNLHRLPIGIRNLPASPANAMQIQKLTHLPQQNQKLTTHSHPTPFRINNFRPWPLESET